jgi:F420-0:gamma-glutamyl ligase
MGKLRHVPVVVVRGWSFKPTDGTAKPLVRAASFDLFR